MGITKFYLTTDAAPFTPTNFRGTWNDTAGAVTRLIDSEKAHGGGVTTVARAEASATNPYRVCLYRGVSGPLASQTFSADTLDVIIGVIESNVAADFNWRIHAYITEGNTDTVRGTLLSDYEETAGVNEWGTTTASAGKALNAGQATSSVVCTAGDRLVIEIGYTSRNSVTTSRTGTLWYGTQNATTLETLSDLSVGGDPTLGAGYISFVTGPTEPGTIAGRVTQAVTEAVYSSADRTGRVTQAVTEAVYSSADRAGRVTQAVVDVGYSSAGGAGRVTQAIVETGYSSASRAGRVTQLAVEVLYPSDSPPVTPPASSNKPMWYYQLQQAVVG